MPCAADGNTQQVKTALITQIRSTEPATQVTVLAPSNQSVFYSREDTTN